MPSTPAPRGWKWTALTDLARLESGHTPSRRHPEYWGGKIPWISIQDARENHGGRVKQTQESINELGIENSSARVLPKNTVCLSRTASVGYVVVMDRPMATSQDFVNWVCSPELEPDFLKYLFIAEGDNLLRFASGAVHQTIYFPEAKAFHICHPIRSEQQRIVSLLDAAIVAIKLLRQNTETSYNNCRVLFEAHRRSLFAKRGQGWARKRLGDLSEVSSGGTPRVSTSEFWNGDVPWYSSGELNQQFTTDPERHISKAGLDSSNAKLFPKGSLLIGMYDTAALKMSLLDRDAAFNQAVAGVKPNRDLDLKFVRHAIDAIKPEILDRRRGVRQKNLSLEKIRDISFDIPKLVSEQRAVVAKLEALSKQIVALESTYERKLDAVEELRRSLLSMAFQGQVSTGSSPAVAIQALTRKKPDISTTDLHAGILAIAYQHHEEARRTHTFGHVKAEKIAHLVEAVAAMDLGRNPIKDAAGPNDYPHFQGVRHRAKKAGYFEFNKNGTGYRFYKYSKFDDLIARTQSALGEQTAPMDRVINLVVPMTSQQAEIVATVYAAWNNLLLEGRTITDEAIVREAREDWHPDKLKIPRDKFFKAIAWMKEKQLVPTGSGKRVESRTAA
jgi:type I restriction enzyme S subunit